MNSFGKVHFFRVDPKTVMETFDIKDEEFNPATEEEKANLVEKRKSISFWRDAWRRFRANKVSMVALFVFIVCLIFAFIGPMLIPYSYGEQYRSSQKLGPMEFSEGERLIKSIEDEVDAFYATALVEGSLTSLDPGSYYLKYKGKTYAFTSDDMISDSVIAIKSGKLIMVKESDISDGKIGNYSEMDFTGTAAEGAKELKTKTSVFPHVFGTDSYGRDLMARTMYGARVSIIIGIVAALIVLIIGSIYGAISGYFGGKVDFVMMRIVELIYSIPEMLIVLLLQVVLKEPLQNWIDKSDTALAKGLGSLGSGIISIFITFAILYWVTMARIIRGQVLQIKKQEYVTAATALGASNAKIIRRHLLPNCVGPLVITTCLQIPSAIFLESFLSFLGIGVSAPMASLGSLCSDALGTITLYPYRLVYPAIILTIIVLSLNLIGDGLRDALDPRLKK